jgi:hypothetical protein
LYSRAGLLNTVEQSAWLDSTPRALLQLPRNDLGMPQRSCQDLGWNAQAYGSSNTCGESDFGLGGCSGLVPWANAEKFCAAAGARLCTVTELQADEARGTGCNLDAQMVWSSTACASTGSSGSYTLAYGSSLSGKTTTCAPSSNKNYVRCCSNVYINNVFPQVILPVPKSAKSCSALGWTPTTYGSPSVCGGSGATTSTCSGAIPWASAKTYCTAFGARLCTVTELAANEARGTGCSLDSKQLWSSTACPTGYLLAYGSSLSGTTTTCAATGASNAVRCCADV